MRAAHVFAGLVLATGGVLGVAPRGFAEEPQTPPEARAAAPDAARDLERRLADLRRENEQLRADVIDRAKELQRLKAENARLRQLNADLSRRRVELPAPRRPAPRSPSAVPEDWRRREFNGQPYYIIPLKRDAN